MVKQSDKREDSSQDSFSLSTNVKPDGDAIPSRKTHLRLFWQKILSEVIRDLTDKHSETNR
jgi:hypothetical protein